MHSTPARVLLFVVTSAVVVFLIVPSLMISMASFSAGSYVAFPPHGLSLKWYGELFADARIRSAFLNSVYVAVTCAVVGAFAGTLAAVALYYGKFRLKDAVQVYLLLPFTMPLAVSAIALLNLYGEIGVIGYRWPVGVAIAAVNLPFMIWAVASSVNHLDQNLEDAATSCGAQPIERFLTVTLPAVMPGVLAGTLIMFVLAFTEFIVSLFLVEVRTMTLPVLVFNEIRGMTTPKIAAIAAIYLLISAGSVWLINRIIGVEMFLRQRH